MQGLYRDGNQVQVSDGTNSMSIPRDCYEERGYKPPFDNLLTKEQYEARNA